MTRPILPLVALLGLIGSVSAHAYIPNSRTILGRYARNNGRGLYQIEQEVQFRTESEPVVLREKWVVENGDSMRLTISSVKGAQESYRLDIVYKDGKRTFIDAQGQSKTVAQSGEFIEPFLHFRSSRSLIDALVKDKVVPAAFMREPKRPNNVKDIKHAPEPLVRLARSGGVVTYAFGEPTPPNSDKASPGLWIDQDAFLFRRIRFPSQVEVSAERHMTSGTIKLPRERTVTWENNSASIRVLSVKNLPDSAASQIQPQSLLQSKAPMRLPDVTLVKEFYSRFR